MGSSGIPSQPIVNLSFTSFYISSFVTTDSVFNTVTMDSGNFLILEPDSFDRAILASSTSPTPDVVILEPNTLDRDILLGSATASISSNYALM